MDPPNSTTTIAMMISTNNSNNSNNPLFSASQSPSSSLTSPTTLSRYENQKSRDWNTFGQYLRNHRPPFSLARCSGAHVLDSGRLRSMPTPALSSTTLPHPPPAPAPSGRPKAASTPSSASSCSVSVRKRYYHGDFGLQFGIAGLKLGRDELREGDRS
ncbi:hypothetical protein RJ639_031436 [Escallonia herrerae]|uniref:ALOG domain-containing protein n=1 Tax=Escallonia herrerae TaxID=1293975 RepID=A0AA89BDV6_9ASTE|nr:hypothetical protein RJ639_031436 [Escallonia herrerae]